jgi:hypothetical protein
MRERLGDTPRQRRLLGDGSATFTGIFGPDGRVLAGPAPSDTETIVYAAIDLEAIIRPKIHHDIAGNYNRFDVLSLVVNRAPLAAIHEATPGAPGLGPESRRLVDELRRRVDSASPAELRRLVEALLASFGDVPSAPAP